MTTVPSEKPVEKRSRATFAPDVDLAVSDEVYDELKRGGWLVDHQLPTQTETADAAEVTQSSDTASVKPTPVGPPTAKQ